MGEKNLKSAEIWAQSQLIRRQRSTIGDFFAYDHFRWLKNRETAK